MHDDLYYYSVKPDPSLDNFVESFWMLHNRSESEKEVIVLPDGRIDLFFSQSSSEPFNVALLGIATQADRAVIAPGRKTCAISFRLSATEYVLHDPVSGLLNEGRHLPSDFWEFGVSDLDNFDAFVQKASEKIHELLLPKTDDRKLKLFDLIYGSNGSLSVTELAEKVHWSPRQINRYFNDQFGLSLKAYCTILRFRASFQQIKDGQLFPEESYADQPHFIREIRRFSGHSPKELNLNKNDRFIQFSTLTPK